jgi:3-methylcrotonyl-CoA carboxylase alpha subunit
VLDKLLIANRGEIACRVIRTARRLGIRTVAVHSEADADARHVRLADEAVAIGPAPARESYLSIPRILEAARATGARAIHPGYGFLSENAEFAAACEAAGLVFVGPPASAIRAMGSKAAAKALLEAAGVPLTPGYHGEAQDPALLAREARRIGYPVLIKASAGGGGKGMRRVDAPEEFDAALASCRREAAQAFGDDRVLLERYVLRPRHVELQVFADRHGNVVHLFERDCSVQRRHQKVLEEAPAPGMTPERRAAMGAAAIEAARAVGYVGAGTVEFIVDPAGAFYFMEMNTRLQVEHPVTEMITGLDLVEWQLRVAAGEPLPLRQEQLEISGHALEARVYAEDPDKGFLPSTGRLVHLALPEASYHVRVDAGVDEGDEIGPHYDPMIAKLIVWDATRERALARMQAALAQLRIVGVSNNVEFLSRLVATPAFAAADLDTGLIEREREFLFPPGREAPEEAWLLAALADLERERAGMGGPGERPLHSPGSRGEGSAGTSSQDPRSPWSSRDGWRLNSRASRAVTLRLGDAQADVRVEYAPGGFLLALGAGPLVQAAATLQEHGALRARIGERRLHAAVIVAGERRHVFLEGRAWPFVRVDPSRGTSRADDAGGRLTAPMPGKVIALLAAPGARVEPGTPLLVLEAMKMEHTIKAPRAGVVKAFHFDAGDQVSEGAELVELEAAPG